MKKTLLLLASIFFILNSFAQNITVTFPNGGEHWLQNIAAPHNIEWESTGVSNFKIEFSQDNGNNWLTIEPNYSGANYYTWQSANVISQNCLIKISDANGTTTDQSNATFTIADKTIYFAQWNTSEGIIRAELRGDLAPITVQNFINLSEKGFYTDLIFHRVIPNFMIQDGDPIGNGTGGPGYSFNDEFNPNLRHSHAGIISMANSAPNTNGSQYFITTAATSWLDDVHSVFGRVIDGMQVCYNIQDVPRDANDKPLNDVSLTISIVEGTPAMSLQNPAANMKTEEGRTIDIEWNSDFTADVKIEFSSDNQANWIVLADSLPADNEVFEWQVPNITSAECFIKITSLRQPANFTINASAFEIRTKPAELARLSFFDNVVADAQNPKNLIMPEKTIHFKAKIHNLSGLSFNNLNLQIVPKNSTVSSSTSTSSVASVPAGAEKWTDAAFSITLPEGLPASKQYIFSIYATDPAIQNAFWIGDFTMPMLERFPFMTVDDNNVPDSQGNGNHKLESGETIELLPKVGNKSSRTIYQVYGKLTSPHDFITFWDDVMGADGMVYDTAYYNGMQPFNPGSSSNSTTTGRDFVFDYTATTTYKTDFVLEMHGYLNNTPGGDWETGGIKMAWGVPFQLNTSSPEVGVNSLGNSSLRFSIFNTIAQGSIVLDYNFEGLGKEKWQGKIYDTQGKLIKNIKINHIKGQQTINCSDLPKGIYLLEISNAKIRKSKKFIL